VEKYLFVVLCLLLVNTGMVCNAYALEVKITIPHNGDTIPSYVEVGGTLKDISADQTLWVFVNPPATHRYYPQSSVEVTPNGFWYANATLGEDPYSGSEFRILAVIADGKANKMIMNYLDKARRENSWPGLRNLPDGTMTRDMITVTRGTS
jgi:hypothetical protein